MVHIENGFAIECKSSNGFAIECEPYNGFAIKCKSPRVFAIECRSSNGFAIKCESSSGFAIECESSKPLLFGITSFILPWAQTLIIFPAGHYRGTSTDCVSIWTPHHLCSVMQGVCVDVLHVAEVLFASDLSDCGWWLYSCWLSWCHIWYHLSALYSYK